ncbi:MAG: ubiquinone/menaquinone biosynthesis methyltransferase [Verrucomicrobiota bacterium]
MQDQDPEFVHRAFSGIADRYVVANHVLSGGIDLLWRRRVARIVRARLPGRILDLATGTGDLALELQRQIPQAEILASDFCEPMLAHARTRGLETLLADALALPLEDEAFDAVTIGFGLRNLASWEKGLQEMARVLRPGGTLVVLDFSLPGPWLRPAYRLYLHRILPLLARALTGKKEAYQYLGDSIERFPSGPAMCQLLRRNGFAEAHAQALSGGIASLYTATTPAPAQVASSPALA